MDVFEALADPTRREIVAMLAAQERSAGDIAGRFPIAGPSVSRHLRVLKDAGMVAEQARGTRRIYHLQAQGLHAVQAYLEGIWGEAAVRFRLLAENLTENPTGNLAEYPDQGPGRPRWSGGVGRPRTGAGRGPGTSPARAGRAPRRC